MLRNVHIGALWVPESETTGNNVQDSKSQLKPSNLANPNPDRLTSIVDKVE